MKKLLIIGAFCVGLALCSGCEWSGGSGVEHWNSSAAEWVDFSGTYKASDGGYIVSEFGASRSTSAVAVTNIVSGELIDTAEGTSTAFGGMLARLPIAGSLNIEVGAVGGYVFWDSVGGSGTVSLGVRPDDGSTGTVNYDTGAWSLRFPAPLASGVMMLASYSYTSTATIEPGNHGDPIYSFVVYQTGNKLQIVDSNGVMYDGSLGSVRTAYGYAIEDQANLPETTVVEAQFSVSGLSQGYNVTIVGVLQARVRVDSDGRVDFDVYSDRVMNATYIEEHGNVADIRASYLY